MTKTFSFPVVCSLSVKREFGDPRDLRHLLDALSNTHCLHFLTLGLLGIITAGYILNLQSTRPPVKHTLLA